MSPETWPPSPKWEFRSSPEGDSHPSKPGIKANSCISSHRAIQNFSLWENSCCGSRKVSPGVPFLSRRCKGWEFFSWLLCSLVQIVKGQDRKKKEKLFWKLWIFHVFWITYPNHKLYPGFTLNLQVSSQGLPPLGLLVSSLNLANS